VEECARAFIDKVIEINRQHGMGDSVPDETYLGAVKESADAVKGVVNAKR
jgi:hypothetical protein